MSKNRVILRYISWKKGFILRALLCWILGAVVLVSDEVTSFDTRFQIRGSQKVSEEIVILKVEAPEISGLLKLNQSPLISIHEISDITDSLYWDASYWHKIINQILRQSPKKVGVALFFRENQGPVPLSVEEKNIFYDQRVVWAALPGNDRAGIPLFANYNRSNIGSAEVLRDDDGVIRKFYRNDSHIRHMVERLTNTFFASNSAKIINYRGPSPLFTEYSAADLLSGKISAFALKNKIVIVGTNSSTSAEYLTPFGTSHRAEVLAQLIDNTLNNRWIQKAHLWFYLLGILLVVITAIFIITHYPQSVSFILMIWFATLLVALSAWVFDSFYVWLPIAAPLVALSATWVIFTGYQANAIERRNWALKQEQKYLAEIEQLKNNFVSLISHDLKTPIAKIQAVADRLLTQVHSAEIREDLKTVRMSSDELNRYIQSILKVMRAESRDFKLNVEVGDINEIIDQAVLQLAPLAKEKSLSITTDLEPMFSIEVDSTLLREVVVNLVENAIKYTPAGGQISIRSRETDHRVQVDVIDTGEGIPAEEMDSVWGKFVRGRQQDLKSKGTGLGLYLVKFFVELHGGRVWLESTRGKGTKVSFSLPIAVAETLKEGTV